MQPVWRDRQRSDGALRRTAVVLSVVQGAIFGVGAISTRGQHDRQLAWGATTITQYSHHIQARTDRRATGWTA